MGGVSPRPGDPTLARTKLPRTPQPFTPHPSKTSWDEPTTRWAASHVEQYAVVFLLKNARLFSRTRPSSSPRPLLAAGNTPLCYPTTRILNAFAGQTITPQPSTPKPSTP